MNKKTRSADLIFGEFYDLIKDFRYAGALLLGIFLCVFVSITSAYSQDIKLTERTRFYTEEMPGDSVFLKADNSFAIPVSSRLILDLHNLQGNSGDKVLKILNPNSKGQILAKYKKIDANVDYQYSYSWKTVLGDTTLSPDPEAIYQVPFLRSDRYPITQGPWGSYSHKTSFAYDFSMPVGTPVTAARDGIVALVEIGSDVGGPHERFTDKANYISVFHADGTIANYYHLKKNGSTVREGQIVKSGDIIGFSGNTGYSGGPHLHFEVVRPLLGAETKQWVNFRWESSDSFIAEQKPLPKRPKS